VFRLCDAGGLQARGAEAWEIEVEAIAGAGNEEARKACVCGGELAFEFGADFV
jgi:hypothetical protein